MNSYRLVKSIQTHPFVTGSEDGPLQKCCLAAGIIHVYIDKKGHYYHERGNRHHLAQLIASSLMKQHRQRGSTSAMPIYGHARGRGQ